MKSIYEEALEKIKVSLDAWDYAENLELLELVEHALEQAQKQEKLLRLYKDLSIAERKRATFIKTKNVDIYNELNKIIEWLEKQIKELEK